MIKRVVLTIVCVLLASAAEAVDVKMGDVTLKLPPPKGYCELTPKQPSDNRMITFLNTALAPSPNALLSVSAECKELNDWRSNKRKLLEHFAQYQVEKVHRNGPFSVKEIKATCDELRAQGQKLSDEGTKNVNDNIHAANNKIDFQGQTFLGVLEDDAYGCYVGLFQKYKAETGDALSQINVIYSASIRDREVFFYMWTRYEDDSTVTKLLADMKVQAAAIRAANGM